MFKTLIISGIFVFAGFSSFAHGAEGVHEPVPLPRPRPEEDISQAILSGLSRNGNRETDTRAAKSCQAALMSRNVEFVIEKPLQNEKGCQISNPVRVFGVISGEGLVSLPGQPVLSCGFALRMATWLADVAAPIVISFTKSPLTTLTTGPGYVCRRRNNKKTGRISEHGFGNAIDITGFQLANRKKILVSAIPDGSLQQVRMLTALRISSCGYFTTVLGPGANEAHRSHFHLDYGKHGRSWNYRICE